MISKRAAEIHERAKKLGENFKVDCIDLLRTVEDVDRERVYLDYDCSSIFNYCVSHMQLAEGLAYTLINIMRKARKVPELRAAVERGLEMTKARHIVPVLTPDNQAEWIELARTVSKDKLEAAVAAKNPRAVERETIRHSSEGRREIRYFTSEARFQDLKRAQDVVSSATDRNAGLDETIAAAIEFYLVKNDPVVKARRNASRVNASVKTRVFARDGGACQMKLGGGLRCGNRRFLDVHHKRSRYRGGVDHPNNLTTLCSGCHREWHRRHGDVPLYEASG